jgi:hypothetical protein
MSLSWAELEAVKWAAIWVTSLMKSGWSLIERGQVLSQSPLTFRETMQSLWPSQPLKAG